MFRINHGGDASGLLGFSYRMNGKSGLTARLRTENLNDSSTRITSDSKRMVKCDRTARNHLNIPLGLLTKFHYSAFSEVLLDLVDSRLKSLKLRSVDFLSLNFSFFCHKK